MSDGVFQIVFACVVIFSFRLLSVNVVKWRSRGFYHHRDHPLVDYMATAKREVSRSGAHIFRAAGWSSTTAVQNPPNTCARVDTCSLRTAFDLSGAEGVGSSLCGFLPLRGRLPVTRTMASRSWVGELETFRWRCLRFNLGCSAVVLLAFVVFHGAFVAGAWSCM